MIWWGLRCFPSQGDRSAVVVLAGLSPEDRREVGRLVLDAGEIEDLRARLTEREQVTTSDVSVMATEYTVCALPEDHPAYRHHAIKVVRRGDHWMVWDGAEPGQYYGTDEEWSFRTPSDVWLADHWLDRDEALELAKQAAPLVECKGVTAAEVLRRTEGS